MDALRTEVQAIIQGGNSGVSSNAGYQAKVTAGGGLNCRTVSINGAVITTYPQGTILFISQENSGWGYTGTGWVSLKYVQRISSTIGIEDDDMDMARFKELWVEMHKELQDNNSSKYSEEARKWAVSVGLIAGNGTEINGEPNCMRKDLLTREQFITGLYRFAQMMGTAQTRPEYYDAL